MQRLLHKLLTFTPYLSRKKLDTATNPTWQRQDTTGEFLNSVLETIFGDKVDIYHPDTFSLNSVFSFQKHIQNEGIFHLITSINDRIMTNNMHISHEQFLISRKPMVIILNSSGNDGASGINHLEFKGSHWVPLIILPKGFKGLIPRDDSRPTFDNELGASYDYDRIYLFDSLGSGLCLPSLLEYGLTFGLNRVRKLDKKVEHLSHIVAADSLFYNNTSNCVQASWDNTCGQWALFCTFMTILEGNDSFWQNFLENNNEEVQAEAGLFLRQVFHTLSTELDPMESLTRLATSYGISLISDEDEPQILAKESNCSRTPPSMELTKGLKLNGEPDMRFSHNKTPRNTSKKRTHDKVLPGPENLEPHTGHPILKKIKTREPEKPDEPSIDTLRGHIHKIAAEQAKQNNALQSIKSNFASLAEEIKASIQHLTSPPQNPHRNPKDPNKEKGLKEKSPLMNTGTMEVEDQHLKPAMKNPQDLPNKLVSIQERSATGDNQPPNLTTKKRTLAIPWKNNILTPTLQELRQFKGNLDEIEKTLGTRPPRAYERRYTKIRIKWKGRVLWPTPQQLLLAAGDLNILLALIQNQTPDDPSAPTPRGGRNPPIHPNSHKSL